MVSLKKQCLSEFLCGLLVSFFGLGCLIPKNLVPGSFNLFQFSMLFGLVIAFIVIIFNPMSGAQFNPGVTLAMVLTKRQDKKTLLPYIASQLAGWFIGAAMVYGVFYLQIKNNTDALFANPDIPGGPMGILLCNCKNQISAIPLEFILTGFMVMLILACNDQRIVNKPGKALFPLVLALYITFAVSLAGPYSGAALNLSRDLGPRLFATIWGACKGYNVGLIWNWDCLIYLFIPAAGAVAGAFIYDYGIARLLPKDKPIIDTKGVINDNYVLEKFKSENAPKKAAKVETKAEVKKVTVKKHK